MLISLLLIAFTLLNEYDTPVHMYFYFEFYNLNQNDSQDYRDLFMYCHG